MTCVYLSVSSCYFFTKKTCSDYLASAMFVDWELEGRRRVGIVILTDAELIQP